MTLGELIQRYLKSHSLTYEEFATQCKLSKGYISMLISNCNPKTGKPPVPKIKTYNDIARALGLSLDELFRQIDDAPVDVASETEAIGKLSPDSKFIAKMTYASHSVGVTIAPDLEGAALKATETLIRHKISRVPILPMSILQAMPNVIIVTFTEMADKSGMDRNNMVMMFGAENQDVITYTKDGNYYVAYNQRLPYYMLQRAMARELGHIVLGHHTSSLPEEVQKTEALFFMRYLLCPRPVIKTLFDKDIYVSVETLGNLTGLYGRSLAGIRETPGAHIPAKMNQKVRAQFSAYMGFIIEYAQSMWVDDTIPADFGTYMDNYEE